jgi:ribosome biogenesis GTPase / thiamine phosphate phosphatase
VPDGPEKRQPKHGRVDFRRNRQRPARQKRWIVHPEDDPKADTDTHESVRAKGDLSRKRTVVDRSAAEHTDAGRQAVGTAVAVRGQFVEVDDGQRIWSCSVRRTLRTRRIEERSPVVVGDHVSFAVIADAEGLLNEGVIERVHPRRTELKRSDGRRTHIIAANVDQVLIISSVREPRLKPHLIDRYLVAAHAGGLPAVICVNKVDLDEGGEADIITARYRPLSYTVVKTSAATGEGIDELRSLLGGKVTLFAGQSGVGKSSLLNAVQPGLDLTTAHVSTMTEKGRHTTTTALWLNLEIGGAAIDTPGIRALDVAMVPLSELEMHFVEFVDRVAGCKYANCAHIREDGCAIKAAVEAGEIDPARYDSYVQLFMERSEVKR